MQLTSSPLTRLFGRNWLPKGLYWRTLLIIVAPAALLQLIVTVVFLNDHWQTTSKRMSQAVAADVTLLLQLYERDPTPATFAELQRLAHVPLRLEITLDEGGALALPRCRAVEPAIDRYLTRSLREDVARAVWYDSTCPGNQVKIRVPVTGGVLQVEAFRDRVQARSGPLFVAWIFGATIFLCVVSVLFIRNQVRPIERLARAMAAFGRGEDVSTFKARGAREVREAAHAFFEMRNRIKRHIAQRAQLLAGVSHDLRTPITRLKLQFALMDQTSDVVAAKRDLADMEETLEEYLAFARGEWTDELEPLSLTDLVAEVTSAHMRSGATLTILQPDQPIQVTGRPNALKRCLANLIDNAVAHGGAVQVETAATGQGVEVRVDDDGPGIDPTLYEDAFRPFSRLDETRTRNAKGVGLGLAIARDVARAHGGEITLSKSPLGGLRAALRLPQRMSHRV
ncbi:MAG: HAMP domain-containing protein [Alphaproteobacteria bacterium]|nr:HAMP domain-containing protein [Alphaproteobacteria bacterium]